MKKLLFLLLLLPVIGKAQSFTKSKPDTIICIMHLSYSNGSSFVDTTIRGYKVYTQGRWQPYEKHYFLNNRKEPLPKWVIVWADKEKEEEL